MLRDFQVGEWRVEPDLHRLSRGDDEVTLEPKAIEVLLELCREAGNVVAKDRLLDAAWPDIAVTEHVLTSTISDLRKAFRDNPRDPQVIQTISKRGYRLIAEVSGFQPEGTAERYRILEKIGQGAMGEVFLAEDSILERRVALKFILDDGDGDGNGDLDAYRRRLVREAKAAAALDHPFICKVYDTGEIEGRPYISMEYVKGRTLKDDLQHAPLPFEQVKRILDQICGALEVAHQNGVVHRDLKPSNIMLTEQGHVKVLDFGVAKRLPKPGLDQDGTQTATVHTSAVGAVPYMSPEQIRNKKIDTRSDLFSLGTLLYEMLTGVNPFRRESPLDTVASVLHEEPPAVDDYVDGVSPSLREALRRLLAKDPSDRFQSIDELRTSLGDAAGLHPAKPRAFPEYLLQVFRKRKSQLPWLALPVAVVLGFAIGDYWTGEDAVDEVPVLRFKVELRDQNLLTHYFRQGLALSPDGTMIAYVAGESQGFGSPPLKSQIFLLKLDESTPRPLEGTDGGINLVFAPDGLSVAYLDSQSFDIKRIDVAGGEPTLVCECRAAFGFSWGANDQIVFSRNPMEGLFQVSANGGEPTQVTVPDVQDGALGHALPSWLPDSKAILLTGFSRAGWKESRILLHTLSTGETRELLENGSDARYIRSGHIVFAREGKLLAAPFDLDSHEVKGPAVSVLESLNHAIYAENTYRESGVAQFSVSDSGLLAYAPGSVHPEKARRIVWVDRHGNEEPLPIEPKQYMNARLSTDERMVLLTSAYPPAEVWVYDRERGILRRQTFSNSTIYAIWGPGGDEFTSISARSSSLYRQSIDSSEEEAIELAAEGFPAIWSPNGRTLIFLGGSGKGGPDLLAMQDDKIEPFLDTRFYEGYPDFSPDGRWLAYESNEQGRPEAMVRPFPGPGKTVQISTNGGGWPVWDRNGKGIYYRSVGRGRSSDVFYFVPIKVEGDTLVPDKPVKLFDHPYMIMSSARSFDVSRDGRFLMITSTTQEDLLRIRHEIYPGEIQFVQNWFREVKLRAGE